MTQRLGAALRADAPEDAGVMAMIAPSCWRDTKSAARPKERRAL
jgi:hypothetical protein